MPLKRIVSLSLVGLVGCVAPAPVIIHLHIHDLKTAGTAPVVAAPASGARSAAESDGPDSGTTASIAPPSSTRWRSATTSVVRPSYVREDYVHDGP